MRSTEHVEINDCESSIVDGDNEQDFIARVVFIFAARFSFFHILTFYSSIPIKCNSKFRIATLASNKWVPFIWSEWQTHANRFQSCEQSEWNYVRSSVLMRSFLWLKFILKIAFCTFTIENRRPKRRRRLMMSWRRWWNLCHFALDRNRNRWKM